MKKLLLITAIALFTVLGLSSQNIDAKGKPQENPAMVYMGDKLEICVTGYEAYEYELLAGQHLDAGTVTITTDGENLTVSVAGLYDLSDIHIYLYTEDDELPTRRPVPGQAPYKLEDIDGMEAELVIPLEEGTMFTLAIHVAFDEYVDGTDDPNSVAGETAYAGDEGAEYDGRGAWFYLVAFEVVECDMEPEEAPVLFIAAHAALTNSETAWALGQYTFIDYDISNKWGWFLEVDEYGVHEFDIYYGAGGNNLGAGTLIGTLVVEYTEEEVTVTYILTEPLLEEIQVFAGYEYPTTGAPGQYDYKLENLGGVFVASVTINVEDLA